MSVEDWSFETKRLRVAEWHAVTEGQSGRLPLPEIVRDLLTPSVTDPLPAPWHGPYSERRAVDWIHERDAEGTQLLAVSRESREVIGLVLLHSSAGPSSGPLELRLGYLIAESQWGKGFASELVRGFIDSVRGRTFGSIVAGVAAANVPSIRVLEKCGFTRAEGASPDASEVFYSLELDSGLAVRRGGRLT